MPQFPLMRATVRAFGLTPIEQDRYEADDLIATYARQARERGADVLIVSADKDLMQLIGPGSRCSIRPRAIARSGASARDEVVAYFGAGADKVVDIQALAGDSTDNVPGAPRHRRQDGGAADRRIRRPRHAARARRRDQAAQAPRDADRSRDRSRSIRAVEDSW